MASGGDHPRGQKRSKAYYRKSAHGGKKHCTGNNVLEPGIRGFLVTCNHDERSAVRESYNILNEYADELYGPDKNAGLYVQSGEAEDVNSCDENDDDFDDVEKALKKEVEGLKKAATSPEKRFQNVATKAKNCVFIRTSLANPVEVTVHIMEDIAAKHLKRARYAARILPVLGTCKANTKNIENLASDVLGPIFSDQNENVPTSFTVLFKMRNNNGTSCGRETVIPAIIKVVQDINPEVKFSWTDYSTTIIVEVVCTVCCLGVAPGYTRLRKYNLQELQQGAKECPAPVEAKNDKGENDSVVTELVKDKENEFKDTENQNDDAEIKENDSTKCDEGGKEEKIVGEKAVSDDSEETLSKQDETIESNSDSLENRQNEERLPEPLS